MFYFCCEDRRRNEIAEQPLSGLNGIEFLEVLDTPDQALTDRQRFLFLHFIHDPTPLGLLPEHVTIEGGERIRDIRVVAAPVLVDPASGSTKPVMRVEVEGPGDFSIYTLRLQDPQTNPLARLDPILSAVDFSFKINCESEFDPKPVHQCVEEPHSEPALDYLARDFLSLRQMILDRMAVLTPAWKERNSADAGIMLVDFLAYVGDLLSYRQDAVATESYLGTCRLRTSARRHARLVDYLMHDGCNARVWVHLEITAGTTPFELQEATFANAVPTLPDRIEPGSAEADLLKSSGVTLFRLMPLNIAKDQPLLLSPQHNLLRFYTWGASQCSLPKGAVRASLRDDLQDLKAGMVLIFKEVLSPLSGDPDDANLDHRHAVRLTNVSYRTDPLGGQFDDPPTNTPVAVTDIEWAVEDALPFPFCISAETADAFGSAHIEDVSIALGNIVLADHGSDFEKVDLGLAPLESIREVKGNNERGDSEESCRSNRVGMVPIRFRPQLKRGPVTQAVPLDKNQPPASARATLRFEAKDALPQVILNKDSSDPWFARQDLISSRGDEPRFVVEVEGDGRSYLRFGDDKNGRRPRPGSQFFAHYRVGNGLQGNIGADTLAHIVTNVTSIDKVNNPLAAQGGVEMESIEEVRQSAPYAFQPRTLPGQPNRPDGRSLKRAVTPVDYAAVTETHAAIQRATATFRWTGSWRTISITVDPFGGLALDQALEEKVRGHLAPYRLAGHDLEIEAPFAVALEITMNVRIKPGYYASDVRRALLDLFSNRIRADGTHGLFHPDNLTFGQTIYLSPLYAAAQAVDGVESVDITTFQRRDQPGTAARDEGRLSLNRVEIARLDNDPNFPERGTFTLNFASNNGGGH